MNIESANMGAARSRHGLIHQPLEQQLERSWHGSGRPRWSHRLWAWGVQRLGTLVAGQAPRISQVTTGGVLRWKVYDPVGDRTRWFEQEQEVRAWLEQRYYLD